MLVNKITSHKCTIQIEVNQHFLYLWKHLKHVIWL